MGAFRFRLGRVLEWYGEQCQLEENRLADLNRALATTREAIARLQAERLGIETDLLLRVSIPAREFVALGLYRLRAKNEAACFETERAMQQTAVGEQRAKVQAVRRQIRLLEKLRERHLADHVYAEQRELENLAGDSHLAKWVREALAAQRLATHHGEHPASIMIVPSRENHGLGVAEVSNTRTSADRSKNYRSISGK